MKNRAQRRARWVRRHWREVARRLAPFVLDVPSSERLDALYAVYTLQEPVTHRSIFRGGTVKIGTMIKGFEIPTGFSTLIRR
jgi:hypothetical protein